VNARWVRERHVEWVWKTATLHADLGSWPLRRGVVPDDVPVREVLKGRLRVDGAPVQIAGVLDELYATDAPLGPTWEGGRPSVAVWAPTAREVALRLRRVRGGDAARGDDEAPPDGVGAPALASAEERVPMLRGDDGVWRVTGDVSWRDAEYAFEVTVFAPAVDAVVTNVVTDPYSLALTVNSRRSVLAELEPPEAWPKPPPIGPRDAAIYELHIRDFSIGDTTVPEAHRGTYLAFTHSGSAGMRHLRALAEAGMTTVHLLPCNDIATIEEERAEQLAAPPLEHLPPDSPVQQRLIGKIRDRDGFNWGYDPLHYSTPEGSYAVDPANRTHEFRAMVASLNAIGLRVVLDVVYNHTPASGQDAKSILDRIVPGASTG
jgi:pullulanase/glycogen debranching enzyme